jgi:hypothetical protein
MTEILWVGAPFLFFAAAILLSRIRAHLAGEVLMSAAIEQEFPLEAASA